MLTTRRRDDAGFGLMEVVVAMAIFGITVSAVLGIILSTLKVTRSNSQRVAASNLATKQIEAARSQLAVNVPDGAVVRTETIGSTVYTIEQNANYVTSGASTSLCADSSGDLAYKLVTATVTWPNMGSTKPVKADTVLALGVGAEGLSTTSGTMAVGVVGATGQPVSGVTVTLSPGGLTRTTGVDGCAVFVNLPVGGAGTDYTATVNQAGFVSPLIVRQSSVTAGVQAGQIQRGGKLKYDVVRTLTVNANPPAGYAVPAGLTVGVRSPEIDTGAQLPSCATAALGSGCITAFPGTAQNLFPNLYDVWAGTCPSPRPAGASTNVDLTAANGSVAVPLQGLDTRVLRNGDFAPQPGYTVKAVSSCGGAVLPLQDTSSGISKAALPAGDWTITVSGPKGTYSQPVTLAPGDAPKALDFVVAP
jgi:prepilin-type N-terminal cleavage/methylation domain-containing protein